jgi:polynucleotide 5'-hydroxyl-kinase GRC3/NOL9
VEQPPEHLEIPEDLREHILACERCVIMLIGGSDTGKTTLAERLAAALAASGIVAIVDTDTGQSRIGPPTTIGWGIVTGGFPGWDAIETEGFYFVGATSPVRSVESAVVGAKLMCDAARSSARFVIVDTTGLVTGSLGCTLKWRKINALKPDVLVAIQRSDELEPLLERYKRASRPKIFRMKTPGDVHRKTFDQRTAYREQLFARYFANSRIVQLPDETVAVRCTDEVYPYDLESLSDRVVSLRDAAGRDLALGILLEPDLEDEPFLVRTPLQNVQDVRTVVIGDLRISPDGKQLESL